MLMVPGFPATVEGAIAIHTSTPRERSAKNQLYRHIEEGHWSKRCQGACIADQEQGYLEEPHEVSAAADGVE